MRKKIVVTGLGWVTPFGCNLEDVWSEIYQGKTATKNTVGFDQDDLYCKVSAQIPKDESYFPWEYWNKHLPAKRAGRFIVYGLEAAKRALLDSKLINEEGLVKPELSIGIVSGSGIGGLDEVFEASKTLIERGANRVPPAFVPSALINLLSGHIAIRHQIKGVNQSVVTACATGAHAIADGARFIREDRADVMVVGGSESAIGKIGVAGFGALKALASGYNEAPEISSRPFDTKRSGFVMGEGAGILILESEEHAIKRGAKIYCEYLESGLSGDAYHMTAPAENGEGAARAMAECLRRSNLKAEDVGYINAHATSTEIGDRSELSAIKSIFGSCWGSLSVSSIKGAIGHTLGAAGAIEAIASVLSLRDQKIPPTINLIQPDNEAELNGKILDLVPDKGKNKNIEAVVSNSFGFGGVNISLAFKKYEAR